MPNDVDVPVRAHDNGLMIGPTSKQLFVSWSEIDRVRRLLEETRSERESERHLDFERAKAEAESRIAKAA